MNQKGVEQFSVHHQYGALGYGDAKTDKPLLKYRPDGLQPSEHRNIPTT